MTPSGGRGRRSPVATSAASDLYRERLAWASSALDPGLACRPDSPSVSAVIPTEHVSTARTPATPVARLGGVAPVGVMPARSAGSGAGGRYACRATVAGSALRCKWAGNGASAVHQAGGPASRRSPVSGLQGVAFLGLRRRGAGRSRRTTARAGGRVSSVSTGTSGARTIDAEPGRDGIFESHEPTQV